MTDTPTVVTPTPPTVAKPSVGITSANLPPTIPPGQTTATATPAVPSVSVDADIVARPLVSPDFTNIKPKNPAMSLRGINRLAMGGQRFEEAKIQGFVVCKPSDILEIPNTMTVKDNTVIYGDLIYMMMTREKYVGALKYNEQIARNRVQKQEVMGQAHEHLTTALNEVPGSRANKSKVSLFQVDR